MPGVGVGQKSPTISQLANWLHLGPDLNFEKTSHERTSLSTVPRLIFDPKEKIPCTPPIANPSMRPKLTNSAGEPLSEEERRERRLAQKRNSYARCAADPAKRAAMNAAECRRYAAKHGPRKKADLSGLTPEQRHTRQLEQQRASRARLRDDPERQAKLRAHETSPARLAYKTAWQQKHAAELNARRREDRKVNQPKYAAWQRDSRKRKREAKRAAH